MTGAILNAAGIVAGGIAGRLRNKPLAAATQNCLKLALAAAAVFLGLRLAWLSLDGPLLQRLKQLAIVTAGLALGKLIGRLLRLQKASNRLGHLARQRIESARPDSADQFNEGFLVCATLFCVAPLGFLGAVQDGLSDYYGPLAVKALMDGLAAMGFVGIFGWGVLMSAVPVLMFQGTIALLCARFLQPWLAAHQLVGAVNAAGGLLVFCVALIILGIKRVQVTDYLPSLVVAPLLTWWLR